MLRANPGIALVFSMLLGATVAACQGCRTPPPTSVDASADAIPSQPTVRLYVLSNIAGALEPCGCTKDQLGGVHHLAAFLESERAAAPTNLVLGAGPMLFGEPLLGAREETQQSWKAETLAAAFKQLSLTGWAPGVNDWAAGAEFLGKAVASSGAALLAGNVDATPKPAAVLIREVGGIKLGLIGVADPRDREGKSPAGVATKSAADTMREGLAEAKRQGARVFVGVSALPRGESLRLADAFPELTVLVIGKPVEEGHNNDGPKAPMHLGNTLVVETSNHLQSVAVVDLFVRGAPAGEAPITFGDASGISRAEELVSLAGRIHELETRIQSWEKGGKVKPEDLAARKADLAKLLTERTKLEEPIPAPSGSFFRYRLVEVREKLGAEPGVKKQIADYYKRVNEHNKTAFADRKPAPAGAKQASFIGVEECTTCHDEERKVWDGTPHSHAYKTLQDDFKEYNLECVNCHVTGYDKPGGSTVTFVDKLKDVQCEECHGPGSLHAKDPDKKGLITLKPDPQSCVASCHHSPHVENFDPVVKMELVLGPGHGK
ncbi:MAG TPA: multiheme c-type cytochrome [Polyangium sp.]|nr:multiheme c-type cytochrome [Polyangium sp.]